MICAAQQIPVELLIVKRLYWKMLLVKMGASMFFRNKWTDCMEHAKYTYYWEKHSVSRAY